ncbi:copper amine oxidase N-terminal domain-containing protein [Desulforamulus ferrireducens]|uniref:Copper amine oxidase-like N-terminal domain-containing protein n=1 Tax=Desulforamulus ferrireducens TaxID=1833852 RepID=A0A1S6IZZ4_9FIRM|nr:copper amine oxidase N-terminal domain-containing protein [Desulforamulus ferrireducens]AQS60342.1 hypothetical protein B0537_15460 [Desulforamulus ferrireducens]
MKRFIGIVIMLAILLSFSSAATAEPIKIMVDGKYLSPTSSPTYINDRLMVPMRSIFEALNANVTWYNGAVIASLGTTEIQLKPNENFAKINGQKVIMSVPSTVVNGVTLVPLRFIGEAMGADVDWLNDLQTVLITSKQFKEDKERYKSYAEFRTMATAYETTKDKFTSLKASYDQFAAILNPIINEINPLISSKSNSVKTQASAELSKLKNLEGLSLDIQSLSNSTIALAPIKRPISDLYTGLKVTLEQLAKDGVNSTTESGWTYMLEQKKKTEDLIETTNLNLVEERAKVLDYYSKYV